MLERLVLGVDGGGTRTRAVVAAESGRVLGCGVAGPGNPRDQGPEGMAAAVGAAVDAARAASRVPAGRVSAAVVGLAGVATEAERGAARRAIEPLGLAAPESTTIDHDLRIAQAGAFAGGPGMILVVGTGSCCYGRTADGREWRAGGWGARLDDGGSATDLGQRAIVAVIRQADGRGPETRLTDAVLEALGIREIREALAILEGPGYRRRIAALGPVVTEAAAAGDRVAIGIVGRAAVELTTMVGAVHDALQDAAGDRPRLAMLGGVLAAGPMVTGALRGMIDTRVPGCEIVKPCMPGVLGAALMALGQLGEPTAEQVSRLRSSGLEAMEAMGVDAW